MTQKEVEKIGYILHGMRGNDDVPGHVVDDIQRSFFELDSRVESEVQKWEAYDEEVDELNQR
jgi:hypothetical protein